MAESVLLISALLIGSLIKICTEAEIQLLGSNAFFISCSQKVKRPFSCLYIYLEDILEVLLLTSIILFFYSFLLFKFSNVSHFLHIMVRLTNLDCIVGAEFAIFGGFGWVHSSVLVEKTLFIQRGLKFSFSRFGLGLAHFCTMHCRALSAISRRGAPLSVDFTLFFTYSR